MLTLIYTSGTTGPPKGVQLIHRNLLAAVEGIDDLIEFPRDGRVISWLPAAHVAERNSHHYLPIVFGLQITCCHDPREVLSYLPEVRPSWFFAVPRIWEKLKAGLETMVAAQPEEQREKMQAALDAGVRKVRLEQAGEPVPAELAEQVARADSEMFAGLRHMLGLDQVLAINVGAAPTPVEVLEFFHAIGLPLAELWGMSETCGAGSVNPPGKIKIGTVGPPAPGIEIKLDTDGEVLVKSDVVMIGYRNLPEQTSEAFTEDGWLRTGDIGEFDEDGYLKIVDRKKELIISAAGKNMSPANIEATLKSASPLIGQACCIGDARPYNTALIVLEADYAPHWAAQQGIENGSLEALAGDERVREAVQAGVDQANTKLARVEQIKRFTIVRGRLAARRRGADAHDEAQAQADRGPLRGADRGDVRRLAGPRRRRAPRALRPVRDGGERCIAEVRRGPMLCALVAAIAFAAPAAAAQPVELAAPYEYLGWGEPQPPASVLAATGVHDLTLAFILSRGKCNPEWDGQRPLLGGSDQRHRRNPRGGR